MERLTPPKKPVKPARQRRAFSTLSGPVETGGETRAAAALARLLDVDAAAARALTHGFHSYAGRMHPTIARGAVATYSKPGDTVVDPFCGSGTVLVEAQAAGRTAVGVDASPLAKAFDRMISPDEVAQAICYLASDAAVMVTGTSVAIDGGKSLGVPAK